MIRFDRWIVRFGIGAACVALGCESRKVGEDSPPAQPRPSPVDRAVVFDCAIDGATFRPEVQSEWRAYTLATLNGAPRDNLFSGLRRVRPEPGAATPRRALDLGAGAGRATRYLLAAGYTVHAVDADPFAVAVIGECARQQGTQDRLTTEVATFEKMTLPKSSFDFINASYSLPFAQPATFPAVWAEIAESLRDGGLLTVQFFGPNHAWADDPDLTILDEARIKELVATHPLKIMSLTETDEVVETVADGPTRFHVFELIAVRRGG